MYMLYDKADSARGARYRLREEVSLFGCNSGKIPKLLERAIPAGQSEPFKWALAVPQALAESGVPGTTLLIDIKPGLRERQLSLCELLDVWGFSDNGWSPIMMRLKPLFMDDELGNRDLKDFEIPSQEIPSIFSLTYMSGTVLNGKLSGKWIAPSPGATNSVLLWPKVWQYFSESAAQYLSAAGPDNP